MKNNHRMITLAIFLMPAISFFTPSVQAQQIEPGNTDPHAKNYKYYLKKQKKQKTTGWIFLTGGAVMGASGLIIQSAYTTTKIITGLLLLPEPEGNNQTGTYIASVGLAAMATSIPFFIASGKNKNRAKIALQQEKITLGHKTYQQSNYNSIALNIRLGK